MEDNIKSKIEEKIQPVDLAKVLSRICQKYFHSLSLQEVKLGDEEKEETYYLNYIISILDETNP